MDGRPSGQNILILGASARAAAFSAAAGGWSPWCVDLFADSDLQGICPAQTIADYPRGFVAAARHAPPGAWMYTGGLENHPALIDEIAASRPLLGNAGDVLRAVRDPFQLAESLASAALPCCEVKQNAAGLPTDGSWLAKRTASSGGSGVAIWNGEERQRCDDVYYQQRIDGLPCAGMFVADGEQAVLLGVTEQLVGSQWLGARPFHYCGSLGPLDLGPALAKQWQRIGQAIVAQFQLVGLFGVDAIVRNGEVWAVEVNPRFPASVEVLERSCGFSAVDMHINACDGTLPSAPGKCPPGWHGKAIVYARSAGIVSPEMIDDAQSANSRTTVPNVADIPTAGAHISTGRPILTVFAAGATRDQLLQRLQRRAQQFSELAAVPLSVTI